MDNERLPHIIYQELLKVEPQVFKYPCNMKTMLQSKGLDFMFDNPDTLCLPTYKKLTWSQYKQDFHEKIREQPSLKHYRMVKDSTFMSKYLKSNSIFKGIQLKFLLRTGTAAIGENLARQHRGNGMCPCCGQYESLKHFILSCPKYMLIRNKLFNSIANNCDENIFNMFISDSNFAMYSLLGDHDVFNQNFLSFLDSAWKIGKSFLL